MSAKILAYGAAVAVASLLLAVGCRSKNHWEKEKVLASEAGSYLLRSKAKTLKVPFVISDEATAKKAILAYLEGNYRRRDIEGADSIKMDESNGKISFYVILNIDNTHVAIFAVKGESEVSEVAIDAQLLK